MLDQLPIGIALANGDGRILAASGGLRMVFGEIAPSRCCEQQEFWRVFDEDERELSPADWPGARALRGETVMPGVHGVYSPPDGPSRNVRISTMPVRDPDSAARAIMLVQETDAERRALKRMHARLERHFVDALLGTIHAVTNKPAEMPHKDAPPFIANVLNLALDTSAQKLPELSPREEEILKLIAWGHSHKEIAARLGIAVKTVEFHRAGAVRKIGISTRAEIVKFAVLQGWMNLHA